MEYKLVRERRKTLVIKILNDGSILVKAPKRCSNDYIKKFVISKQAWIEKNVHQIKNNIEKNKAFYSLNKILILGDEFDVIDHGNYYQIGDIKIRHTKKSKRENIIKNYLTKLSEEYVLNRCRYLSLENKIEYNSAKIISARKKWGSCNASRELRFNFRLIMLPKYLIDYVVCHELCHIKELNHSNRFWNLLYDMGYDKKIIKEKFKKYNFMLELL